MEGCSHLKLGGSSVLAHTIISRLFCKKKNIRRQTTIPGDQVKANQVLRPQWKIRIANVFIIRFLMQLKDVHKNREGDLQEKVITLIFPWKYINRHIEDLEKNLI